MKQAGACEAMREENNTLNRWRAAACLSAMVSLELKNFLIHPNEENRQLEHD